jgi:5-methylcytosine-specific restriction protein A
MTPIECPYCQSQKLEQILLTNGVHHSKLICGECSRHIKFLPKPENEKICIKRRPNRNLLKTIAKGFCSVCLRDDLALPANVVLEAHHIVPVKDGGTDEKGNLIEVCSDCHKLIHHVQRTFSSYIN